MFYLEKLRLMHLRFTILFPMQNYTEAVENTVKLLEDKGFKKVMLKNYWEKGDTYQGINAVFRSPQNFCFELQFHTPESFQAKSKSHELYEKFRVETDPEKRLQYFNEGVDSANEISIPDNVMRIPVLKV
jgi:hypothetical protein